MRKSHRNAIILLFTCWIRRSNRSRMNSLFLVVGCSVILFIRTCVNSLFSPDHFYLSTASLLPLPPIALSSLTDFNADFFGSGFGGGRGKGLA
jgi:hypothetical protein